jgi:CRISPR-associated protein Cas2
VKVLRNRFIVTYDIKEEKRLKKVFNLMRGFGDHLQYSVFICELSPAEKVILIARLNELILHTEDSVIIVNIGFNTGKLKKRIETMGAQKEILERTAVIV